MQSDQGMYGVPRRQDPPRSMLRLVTTGASSTNTFVRTFTTVVDFIGYDIQYVKDAVSGDKMIAVTDGVYAIYFCDTTIANTFQGITLNADPTVNLTSQASKAILTKLFVDPTNNNIPNASSITVFMKAGDVIRAMTDASNLGTNASTQIFCMTKVSS